MASKAKRRKDSRIMHAMKPIIDSHLRELSIRRRQLTERLPYGRVDEKKWIKEIDVFLGEVVCPHIPPLSSWGIPYVESVAYIQRETAALMAQPTAFNADISPIDYEHLVASALKETGWDARTTAATGDQGIDVIAERGPVKLVVQCKLYSKPVGNAAVQEVIAGKTFENATHAAVVTNAGYTKSARQLADSAGVLLLHHDQLGDLDSLMSK